MSPAVGGWLVGLTILFVCCVVLAIAAHSHRKQLAIHDKELATAIGVGQDRETTDWLQLISGQTAGRHRT